MKENSRVSSRRIHLSYLKSSFLNCRRNVNAMSVQESDLFNNGGGIFELVCENQEDVWVETGGSLILVKLERMAR